MIIKAFDSSQIITTAMVQRGYDGNLPPIRQQPFVMKDLAISGSFVAVMAIAWCF